MLVRFFGRGSARGTARAMGGNTMLDAAHDGSFPGSAINYDKAKASALIVAEQGSRLESLPGLLAHCRDESLDTIVIAQQSDESGDDLLGRIIRRLRTFRAHGRSLRTCIVLAGPEPLVERRTIMDAAFSYLSEASQSSGLIVVHADGADADEGPLFEYSPKRPARLRKCLAVARSSVPAAAEFEEFSELEEPADMPAPTASGVFPALKQGEEETDTDDESEPFYPAARYDGTSAS